MAGENSLIEELYQDVILDHSRKPHHFGELADADRTVDAYNPLCGDRIKLFVDLNGDGAGVEAVSFTGAGCAICNASASMMTDLVWGKSTDEALDVFECFHRVMMTPMTEELAESDLEALGEAAAITGVRRLPMRVKCATLAWHALREALTNNEAGTVTTE